DPKTEKRITCLISDGKYRDFVLRFSCRCQSGVAGVNFRSREDDAFHVTGCKVAIGPDAGHSGNLFEEGDRGKLAPVLDEKALKKVFKERGWNDYEITALSAEITIKINGVETVKYVEPDAERAAASGVLALQMIVTKGADIALSDLRIKELKREAGE